MRSVRIYLSTPEISLARKIAQTCQTAENHRHPEGSLGSSKSGHFAIRVVVQYPKQCLTVEVQDHAQHAHHAHDARGKEDRSKHDRSKHERMCALGRSRASARGRRRCSSGAAPGEATENSCFPSRKTNLPPVGKSSTFSLCKNATVNGKQLCGKDNLSLIHI